MFGCHKSWKRRCPNLLPENSERQNSTLSDNSGRQDRNHESFFAAIHCSSGRRFGNISQNGRTFSFEGAIQCIVCERWAAKPLICSRNTSRLWLSLIGVCRISLDWNSAGAYVATSRAFILTSSCLLVIPRKHKLLRGLRPELTTT